MEITRTLANRIARDNTTMVRELGDVSDIRYQDFLDMDAGRILAIIVNNLISVEHAESIVALFKKDYDGTVYQAAPSIGKDGLAAFEINASDDGQQRYRQTALKQLRKFRQQLKGLAHPVDLVQLALDEALPAGCVTERLFEGEPSNKGLTRYYQVGSTALPHVDRTDWDLPQNPVAQSQRGRYAMNIYIKTGVGGDLNLWDFGPQTPEQFAALQLKDSYGLDRQKLPYPVLTLTPQVGQLIIFNAEFVHEVSVLTEGERIACSGFLALRGPQQPGAIYS